MNESIIAGPIDTIDELEQRAQSASTNLNKANGRSAVWDKALKALKPGLADLEKIRREAGESAAQARLFLSELEASYDSDTSNKVREAREEVDGKIDTLEQGAKDAADDVTEAKNAVVAAKNELDKSTAEWDTAQKDLLAVPKDIQEGQKLIVKLQGEAKDFHAKHQPIETVVKLEDLKRDLGLLNENIKSEHEAEKWKALIAAVNKVISKTEILVDAQAKVPALETTSKEAKTKYEEAVKNRLTDINNQVANKPTTPEIEIG